MKNERDVKKKIKAILDKYDWFWFMPPANGFGKGGISDIIALHHGTMLAVEAKFGMNRPTPLQVGFCNSIRKEDGFAFVVNERNIDYLEAWCGAFHRSVKRVGEGGKPDPEDGAMMVNALYELSNKPLDT